MLRLGREGDSGRIVYRQSKKKLKYRVNGPKKREKGKPTEGEMLLKGWAEVRGEPNAAGHPAEGPRAGGTA